MGGHVSSEVVAFPEGLPTDGALEAVVPALLVRVLLLYVLGAHVIHQIRRHAERNVALGAHVLRREAHCVEGCGD